MDADDTTATIAALEDRRFAAMCARDWATLDELLSDDLSYTHSSARVDSKASYIQGMRDNIFVYRGVDVRERRVMPLGDTALVFGHAVVDVLSRGTPKLLDSRTLAVWHRENGAWRFLAYQPTPVPPG